MNFFEFAENINRYSVDKLVDDIQIAIEKNAKVLELQKNQWQEGKDSNGNLLGLYSYATEILSGGRKKKGEPFDLYDTGDFYKKTNLFGEQKNNDITFFFDSDGTNAGKLLERLGERIFGLQQKNIDITTEIVQETMCDLINKNLKLK